MSHPPTKKTLGQHWLHDVPSLEFMCEAADVQSGDVILEIGPGTGTLTERLLARGAEVVALEYDTSLIPSLQKKFSSYDSTQFWVEPGDIRRYDFRNMPAGYKIVANIPYYLTSVLMRVLADTSHKPAIAALLMQKEVAERIAAEPGETGILSILTQFYYQVSTDALIPAHLFTPPPKVDSQILVLQKRQKPLYAEVDEKVYFQIVKAGFSARRKKLRSSLSGGLRLSKPETEHILNQAGISPDLRAQELSLDDWYALYKVLQHS